MNRHEDADYLSAEVARDNRRRLQLVDRLCWALGLVGLCYLIAMCAAWQC